MNQQPAILASSWTNGLFVLDRSGLTQELPNRTVRGLSDDLNGGAIAVVGGQKLYRRTATGDWQHLATSELDLAVTLVVNGKIIVGTEDARVLILEEDGSLHQIDNFDAIEGRETWYAGTAVVNGEVVGPPLGIRSLSGAGNGLLFANVHVGGIPRSTDGGLSWAPTIAVELDAHEVRVHPGNTNLVAAATAEGLCLSYDAGESWSIHTVGLHASYCSAVAFSGDRVFVAASDSHFSPQGAIYRRSTKAGNEPLIQVRDGLPHWLGGIADTSCIASNGQYMALAAGNGDVYVSSDTGAHWRKCEETMPQASSVLIVR